MTVITTAPRRDAPREEQKCENSPEGSKRGSHSPRSSSVEDDRNIGTFQKSWSKGEPCMPEKN